MPKRRRAFALLIAASVAGGCSSASPPPRAVSPEERQQWERRDARAARARELLDAGDVRAAQSLQQFLDLCTPYRIDFVDRYAFIEFYGVPNLTGLSLIAVHGKLASATDWSCQLRRDYFNSLTEYEKRAAWAAYETRLYGDR